jgi:hypothetical protein
VSRAEQRLSSCLALSAFSARRTEADYQAWRDERDWTARKYAMRDRGAQVPPHEIGHRLCRPGKTRAPDWPNGRMQRERKITP